MRKTHKLLVFLASELLAAAFAFLFVVLILLLLNQDLNTFIIDLKTRLIGLSFFIPLLKILSGYYLFLWVFLKFKNKSLTSVAGMDYLSILGIAVISVLLLILLDSTYHTMQFDGDLLKRVNQLIKEFFLLSMAKFVYAGIVSTLISPKILQWFLKKNKST